jgi:hypothetical protein
MGTLWPWDGGVQGYLHNEPYMLIFRIGIGP